MNFYLWLTVETYLNRITMNHSTGVNLPEISRNTSRTLEVITSIFSSQFADIPGSRPINKLLFLNIMHKVKTQRSGELLSKTCLFYSITLQYWTWKQLIDISKQVLSSSWDGRSCQSKVDRKVGEVAVPLSVGGGGSPSNTMSPGLRPPYQVASWSVQPFGHNATTYQTG